MTFTFFLMGSSGDKLRLSFISSPDPVEPQWFSLTPLPMKSTANRFGNGEEDVWANADIDSSHGSAMVTPAPRRTVRRDSFISIPFLLRVALGLLLARAAPRPVRTFLQELRARYNRFYKRAESITVRRHPVVHALDQRLVREEQRAAQRVHEHFTTKVVQKVFFPVGLDVALQTGQPRPQTSARESGLRVDRTSAEVFRSGFADGPVALEREPE